MAWFKNDDRRHQNPKLLRAGLAADGLHNRMGTYSSANETDGFVDDIVLPTLGVDRGWEKALDALAREGLIHRDDVRKGWWVNDYLEYNPSHASLEEKRERDRLRKESGRSTQRVQRDSARIPRGRATDSSGPDPTRPDPYSEANASSSSEDEEELAHALEAIARDRLAKRVAEMGSVTMVTAWLRTTIGNLRTEHADVIRSLASGLSAREIRENLEPVPAMRALVVVPPHECDNGWILDENDTAWPCETCRAAS